MRLDPPSSRRLSCLALLSWCVASTGCGRKDQQAAINPDSPQDAMSDPDRQARDSNELPDVERADTTDPGWAGAYDVLVQGMRPVWRQLAPRSIALAPATAPDGTTIPYFLRQTLGRRGGVTIEHLLVANEVLVDPGGGSQTLTVYLRSLSFPAEPRSRYHIAQLLMYFDVLPDDWAVSGHAWETIDDYHADAGGKPVTLVYEGGGAVMTFQRHVYPDSGVGGGEAAPRLHRLEVVFDSQANISLREAARQGGRWQPVP
jgi:hypothetical protein